MIAQYLTKFKAGCIAVPVLSAKYFPYIHQEFTDKTDIDAAQIKNTREGVVKEGDRDRCDNFCWSIGPRNAPLLAGEAGTLY